MRLFADENLPASILHWLRDTGHDVASATEIKCGEVDEYWLNLANTEERLIGVILLRMDEMPVRDWIVRLKESWSVVEANPKGKFVVISSKRVRVRKLP